MNQNKMYISLSWIHPQNKSNLDLQAEYDKTIEELEKDIEELNSFNSSIHEAIKNLTKEVYTTFPLDRVRMMIIMTILKT